MLAVVVVAVMSGAAIWSLSHTPSVWHDVDMSAARRQVSATSDRIFKNDYYNFQLIVPEGWYLHERRDGAAILTKKEIEVIPKETEWWTLGGQMIIVVEPLISSAGKKLTPEKWVATNIFDVANDKRTWESSDSVKMLRLEHVVTGAANQALTYYVFNEKSVVVLTLYPYSEASQEFASNLADFEKMVRSISFTGYSANKKSN